jgi:hypothetical protein
MISNGMPMLPLYEQVLEFLVESPSTQEIINFRPDEEAQRRFSQLLAANRERELSVQEEEELDHYVQIDRMMSLLKAKAYRRLDLLAA